MGSRTVVTLFDDLDGSTEDVRTVLISLDGRAVELDLSQKNYDKVAQFLEPYIAAGRRSGASTSGRRRRSQSSTPAKPATDTQAIRDWAKAQGHKVSDRGRVSAEVIAAYKAAH